VKLTTGFPSGDLGRIGIDVYRRNPSVVYATIEHRREGGIYRSDDSGRTWTRVNALNPRPSYYSQVRIDPTNDRRIYVLGPSLYVSDDAGKTFRSDGARNVHVDHHALWIDPRETTNLVIGNDGGVFTSRDGARTWTRVNNIPLGQFYSVGADMRQPYHLYGGLQDNGVWSGPSATWHRVGPLNDDWIQVAGGDGMVVAADPLDPGTAYVSTQNGRIMRFDTASGERKGVRPYIHDPAEDEAPAEGGGGAAASRPPALMRFYWTAPLVVSPHNPRTLYVAGNRVWRSLDRGERWMAISPDIAKQINRAQLEIMGKTVGPDTLSANDGVSHYGTATAFAESPVSPGLLLVGTDDGNVQVSKDGGVSWTDVSKRFPGVPDRTPVSRVVLSSHDGNRMFVAFDGHQQDDFRPYVFRSDDAGATWRPIVAGLDNVVRVVAEDPRHPALLFAGLENGAAMSLDGGASWSALENGLPDVPVADIYIHPRDRDLILGTHGRSIYVLGINPLQDLTARVRDSRIHVFEPRRAMTFNYLEHRDFLAQGTFVGANPPYGATIDYWIGEGSGDARIVIKAGSGTVVRELTGAAAPGVHRIVWDLRYTPPPQPPRGEPTSGVDPSDPRAAESTLARVPGDFGGGGDPTGGEAGGPRQPVQGPEVLPGEYVVTVAAGGVEQTARLIVEGDRRVQADDDDRKARFDVLWQIYQFQRQVHPLQTRLADVTRQLRDVTKSLAQHKQATDEVKKSVEEMSRTVRETQSRLGRALQQAAGVGRDVQASTSKPTVAQREQFERGAQRTREMVGQAEELLSKTLATFAADFDRRAPAGVLRLTR
jgi:photosystem II stability/assembly factor-like uncharacterized protein